MELTDRAEALWASYEAEVRSRLGGRGDVDVGDVLAGIREHVEAELSRRGVERVTAEDMAEVLDRLGGPAEWAGHGEPGAGAEHTSTGVDARAASPRWPGFAALGLVLAGVVLILLGLWWSWAPGWGLLGAGVVVARVSLEGDDPEVRASGGGPGGTVGAGPTRRLAWLVWWAAAIAGVLALLVAPALLTWVAAQIGGPLEAVLPGRPGVPGAPGAPGYWGIPVVVGASATAAWWLVLAGLAARLGDGARRLLGPARGLLPTTAPHALAAGAVVSILFSLIAGVLA